MSKRELGQDVPGKRAHEERPPDDFDGNEPANRRVRLNWGRRDRLTLPSLQLDDADGAAYKNQWQRDEEEYQCTRRGFLQEVSHVMSPEG
jgi:hypothetical protein